MQKIEVERFEYTARDSILSDRDMYILKLSCIVDNDSYLFSSSLPIILEREKMEKVIRSRLEELKSRNVNERDLLEEVSKLVREISIIKKTGGTTREFSKINERYFIPGSTLKGAIRSRIEYKFKVHNGTIKSCYIVESDFLRNQAVNHIKFWGESVTTSRGRCDATRGKVCIVCDMFGSPSLASLVYIDDAYMYKGDSMRVNELNGIEAIEPGSIFTTTIICKNFDSLRLGLLLLGLELFSNSPVLVGMYKYRFNVKLGRLFKERYSFGLIKFKLDEIYSFKERSSIDVNDLIKKCKDTLDDKLNEYIDWERGVIRYGNR